MYDNDHLQPFGFIECHRNLAKGFVCGCAICVSGITGYQPIQSYSKLEIPCAIVSANPCVRLSVTVKQRDGHNQEERGDRTRVDTRSTGNSSSTAPAPFAGIYGSTFPSTR